MGRANSAAPLWHVVQGRLSSRPFLFRGTVMEVTARRDASCLLVGLMRRFAVRDEGGRGDQLQETFSQASRAY